MMLLKIRNQFIKFQETENQLVKLKALTYHPRVDIIPKEQQLEK